MAGRSTGRKAGQVRKKNKLFKRKGVMISKKQVIKIINELVEENKAKLKKCLVPKETKDFYIDIMDNYQDCNILCKYFNIDTSTHLGGIQICWLLSELVLRINALKD